MSERRCRELLEQYAHALDNDLEFPDKEECRRAIAASEQREMIGSALAIIQKAEETQGKNFLDEFLAVQQEGEGLRTTSGEL